MDSFNAERTYWIMRQAVESVIRALAGWQWGLKLSYPLYNAPEL